MLNQEINTRNMLNQAVFSQLHLYAKSTRCHVYKFQLLLILNEKEKSSFETPGLNVK